MPLCKQCTQIDVGRHFCAAGTCQPATALNVSAFITGHAFPSIMNRIDHMGLSIQNRVSNWPIKCSSI